MKLLTTLALCYLGIVALLYFAQGSLLFPGAGFPSRPLDSPRRPERLELPTGTGAVLHGMLFPAETGGTDLLIGFGGNAQDAEMLGQDLAADFRNLNVAVFHYRGYGPSTGRPSEAALLEDARAIHDMLVSRLAPERTFAIGVSLGSAVAAHLSKARPLAGAILITPFDSIEAVAKETYFWVPVGPLLRHRFPTVEFMTGNPTPVAVIAAAQDRVIRPRRTAALVERLENLVFYRALEGADHNTLYQVPIYEETLDAAFAAIAGAATAPADRASAE
jgi:pimeloyl-ACP methyl ester carboxylesterase